jgi:hypothetical protein
MGDQLRLVSESSLRIAVLSWKADCSASNTELEDDMLDSDTSTER